MSDTCAHERGETPRLPCKAERPAQRGTQYCVPLAERAGRPHPGDGFPRAGFPGPVGDEASFMSRNRVYVLMVLAAAFSSGAFITGKMAVREFPPCTLTFFRFFIALPFIFAILVKSRSRPLIPTLPQRAPLIVMGLAGPFAYHVLVLLQPAPHDGHQLLADWLIAACRDAHPVDARFYGERLSMRSAAGIVLAFCGIALVVSNGSLAVIRELEFNPGDGLMLGAVLSWAMYMVMVALMASLAITPVAWTAYTFLVCTVVTIPFALWEQPMTFLPAVSLGGWLSVGYMALFSSVLAYWFQQIGIQEIGPARTALFTNLVKRAVQAGLISLIPMCWTRRPGPTKTAVCRPRTASLQAHRRPP